MVRGSVEEMIFGSLFKHRVTCHKDLKLSRRCKLYFFARKKYIVVVFFIVPCCFVFQNWHTYLKKLAHKFHLVLNSIFSFCLGYIDALVSIWLQA